MLLNIERTLCGDYVCQLNYEQVHSSIARRLGLEYAGMVYSDRNVEGVVEMMLDATQNYQKPLDEERYSQLERYVFKMRHAPYSDLRPACCQYTYSKNHNY